MKDNSIKWKRLMNGMYDSVDGRFSVAKGRCNQWSLKDNNNPDRLKNYYNEKSLKACKAKALSLLEKP